MKAEEQRIAIAKACGHKNIYWQNGQLLSKWGAIKYYDPVPDYLNDLNAMASAEKILFMLGVTRHGRALDVHHTEDEYLRELLNVCKCPRPELYATAAQRAEAFLRTLNLWIS